MRVGSVTLVQSGDDRDHCLRCTRLWRPVDGFEAELATYWYAAQHYALVSIVEPWQNPPVANPHPANKEFALQLHEGLLQAYLAAGWVIRDDK